MTTDLKRSTSEEIVRAATPGEGMPQMKLNRRFCCCCLHDRDTKGGRYRGALFTCAECEEKLQGGPRG